MCKVLPIFASFPFFILRGKDICMCTLTELLEQDGQSTVKGVKREQRAKTREEGGEEKDTCGCVYRARGSRACIIRSAD